MRNHFLRAGGIPSTTLIDPYISGKLHYYKQTSEHDDGAFGAFWVHSSGATEQNVYINPTGISQFLERSATIQTDEDVTDAEGAWKSFEIDLSGVTSPGRIVFYARRVDGTDYRCDFGLDDIKLYAANGTVVNFDPSSSSVRTSNLWVRLNEAKSGITSYSTAKTNHPASSGWEAVVLEDEVLSHWHDDNISNEILLEKLNKDVDNIRFHRVDVAVNNPKNNNDNLFKEYTEVPF